MNSVFVKILNQEFSGQYAIETVNKIEFIVFPAKSADFGDVDICEEALGQYIVTLGKFTHAHFDDSNVASDKGAEKTAAEITDFLMRIFENDIVCYGSHEGGGGYVNLKEMYEFDEEILEAEQKLFVWSGKYSKPTISIDFKIERHGGR